MIIIKVLDVTATECEKAFELPPCPIMKIHFKRTAQGRIVSFYQHPPFWAMVAEIQPVIRGSCTIRGNSLLCMK